ncbi:uncharacterized protein LOC123320994 [Coccinella septempunctata]|uniref:uncharacterized protein LOC123320994 n=1 Tax=Coccinella septempunctata TaxID=41139 RepID=UPI001D06B064|nr:uncharacterized protein LOC123320994 [Coccinella septempunctata]
MSRGRKRKSDKGLFSADSMKQAVKDVIVHNLSLRKAAEKNNVKHQTLARYVKKTQDTKGNKEELSYRPHYDTRRVFSDEQENILKDFIIKCSQMCYGRSTKDVRQLAYELAVHNKIHIPKQWIENKTAGVDWLQGFMKRHPELSIRQPEACSLSRATSFNRNNVEQFFRNLEDVLKRYNGFAAGTRVYNLDETSTTTVQKSSRILAKKGVKQINKVTSGERGLLVTTCCIISSAGNALPPAMIFPRVNFKPHMLHGAPSGTLGLATPSGWMNSELFVSVIKHFIFHSGSSKLNPTLLLFDNHESHLSIETLNLAKDNGVVILTLPPHCSNKLQPLDVSVFGPFKTYYNSALDSWMMTNPGIPVTIFQIAECVGYAFDKSMTPNNIKAGFEKCGIVPFDSHVFGDGDFRMSSVTDREEPSKTSQGEITVETPTDKSEVLEAHTGNKEIELLNRTPEKNTSEAINFKSPEELFGYPKAKPRKTSNPRKRGKSIIATDTPEKLEIENKFLEKKRKESLRMAKRTKRMLVHLPIAKKNRQYASSSESEHSSFISDSSDAESFDELNMNGKAEVKAKWQNLRSNYMREKRKLKNIPSGADAKRAKITWPYFKSLWFLDPPLKHKATSGNVPESANFNTSEIAEDNTEFDYELQEESQESLQEEGDSHQQRIIQSKGVENNMQDFQPYSHRSNN